MPQTVSAASRFVPLITARAVVRPKPSVVEKFQRAVIEASKQCGRNRLMSVDFPEKWPILVQMNTLPATRLVLHTGPGLAKPIASGGCAIAIGPEGGFTPEEIALATAAGWTAASLGPRVLRMETAAIAAAAILGERPG